MKGILLRLAGWTILTLGSASPLFAAGVVDIVGVDLNPLIDQAARSPEQFAVNIAHSISSSTQGKWSQRGSTSTWAYSVRIPTAISMSFHAPHVILPPSAVLTVSTARTASTYTARNVGRNGLWGRPMPGESLKFSLSVKSSEATLVHFHITDLQAGYRSLGGGVADHPHFSALKSAAAAAAATCTQNYSCDATTANQGPAQATVAIIIGNLYQCTGTLLNDTSGDGTPYVLTARHCESGQLGGGNPDAAASVEVYWDAVTACSTTLGSIYDSGTLTQGGATTALEQQDIWLIQLDTPPAATDAYYAGWDASGAAITGGYTIDHALGEDKQYVAWNGTDLLVQIPGNTLSVAYDSTFWGVVNSLGNLGAGGSGSGLFGPNNLVVGSASLAALPGGPNTAGVCPASPPAAPSASTVTALFTALSGVWTSTADATSSTGSKTLKALLDPGSTGQLTTATLAIQPMTLMASGAYANTGDPVTLSWSAQGATSCVAWGGTPGDGWAGAQPASGSIQVTNQTGGAIAYSLYCAIGDQVAEGNTTVNWNYIAPYVTLSPTTIGPMAPGATTAFNWEANLGPCVATGGTPGDGWAGPQPTSGAISLTVTQLGITQYILTCGSGQRTATSVELVDGAIPKITLAANVTEIGVGQEIDLLLFSSAGFGIGPYPCSTSGGSSTDGWASATATAGSTSVKESVAGTYTYTEACTGTGWSTSSSATVFVNGSPPPISISAIAPQQQIFPATGATSTVFNLLWNADLNGCIVSFTSNSGVSQSVAIYGGNPSGGIMDAETAPGVVTYTLECGSLQASTTIDWITTATPSGLSTTASTWAGGEAYPVSWSANSGPCVASGGASGDGWAGAKAVSGTQSLSESQPGTYVFALECGSGTAATTSSVAVTVPPRFIQVYFEPAPTPTFNWHSTVGPCTYLDGSAANSVGETVPPTGSAISAATVSGTYLFSISCGSGTYAMDSATFGQVTVIPPTVLTASVSTVAVDGPVTLTWSSGGNSICYATGGDGEAPWIATLGGTGSGTLIVTSPYAGAITYGVNCNNQLAQVTVTYTSLPATAAVVATPVVTLTSSAGTETPGQSVTLNWSAKNADGCSASGGQAGDGWTGSLASSGSMSVTEKIAGTVTYSIVCTGAPPAATASAIVIFASAPAATSNSGSGGGGALDLVFLLSLALPLGWRVRALALANRQRGPDL